MHRRLVLKSERLTELVDAELAAVAGAIAGGFPTKDCSPTKLYYDCPTMLHTGLNTECTVTL